MILIADAGSTKTSWAVVDGPKISYFETKGINPVIHPESEILECFQVARGKSKLTQPTTLYFFGSGCNSALSKSIIESSARAKLLIDSIRVESDMLGAAIALCDNAPGIACILGTGSNSCFFDGKVILTQVASGGYILGDEGSGTDLGKTLMRDFLRNKLPADLKEQLVFKYGLSDSEVLRHIYSEPKPNLFLSSFSLFINEHIAHPHLSELVHHSLLKFFENHIFNYPEYHKSPIHFTGSVAFHYENILKNISGQNDCIFGKVIQQPITELAKYYAENI